MSGVDFSTDDLLAQARGNLSAIWYLAIKRAGEREGTVEDWARYVGDAFAPSWDEMGDAASALEVGRQTAFNFATTADIKVIDLAGDETRATVTAEGPEQAWIDRIGVSVEDLDRFNELIMAAIAERRGLAYAQERDGTTIRMTFTRG